MLIGSAVVESVPRRSEVPELAVECADDILFDLAALSITSIRLSSTCMERLPCVKGLGFDRGAFSDADCCKAKLQSRLDNWQRRQIGCCSSH